MTPFSSLNYPLDAVGEVCNNDVFVVEKVCRAACLRVQADG